MKLQIQTYENAHNPPYGLETITFKVSSSRIQTFNFEHQEE